MRSLIIVLVAAIALLIFLNMVLFAVDETEQVVVTQMGEPVRVVQKPGLYFKLPYPIQNVHVFEDRILEYDANPDQIYTQDKKNLIVDNYARWRITDPLKFMQALRTERGALSRLDDIVYSVLREELGQHTLSEVVSINREELMVAVTERCNASAQGYGIEIMDVRIKRADLPRENEEAVFGRMRAERNREAMQYRSEGEEEALKVRAETDLEVAKISAGAYQEAQKVKGEGDAEALTIYAQAYEQDPTFYEFTRTLEAYERAIDQNTVLVLPPETRFFQYLSKRKK